MEKTKSRGNKIPSHNLTNDILPAIATVAPNKMSKQASLPAKINEAKTKSEDGLSTDGIRDEEITPSKATSTKTETSTMDAEEIVL